MERDPEKLMLLERWKQTLQSRHTVASFRDGLDLAAHVTADLARVIEELQKVAKLTEVEGVISDALSQGAPEASLLSAIRRAVSSLPAMTGKREPTVFLSYAHVDSATVNQVATQLQAAGIRVFLDRETLQSNQVVENTTEEELLSAEFVVFFITPNSVQSDWVMRQPKLTLNRQASDKGGAVILPILLEDVEVPPLLRQFRWVDLRDGDIEKGVAAMVEEIHRSPMK